MVYTTAIVALGTLFYAGTALWQVYILNKGAEQTAQQNERMIAASERIAETTIAALNEAKRQNEETANRAERAIDASRDFADAAKRQANAAISQAGSGRESASAAAKSASIAEKALITVQRPLIGVVSMHLSPLEVGRKAVVEITFQNSGRLPAYRLTSLATMLAKNATPGDIERCPELGAIRQFVGMPSRATLPVNGAALSYARSDSSLNAEEIAAIKDGRIWIFVRFRADYSGEWSKRDYFVEVYSRYNPTNEKFDICPTRNDSN